MTATTAQTSDSAQRRLPILICEIYRAVRELEELVPGKRFTPDGHMVGSIGEAWATYLYDLAPLPNSTERHDAKTRDGRLVQIKTTQRNAVSTYPAQPDVLLVLRLVPTGEVEEIYNGPGQLVWDALIPAERKPAKNGQHALALSSLRRLMKTVPPEVRLPRAPASSG